MLVLGAMLVPAATVPAATLPQAEHTKVLVLQAKVQQQKVLPLEQPVLLLAGSLGGVVVTAVLVPHATKIKTKTANFG